MTDCRDIAVILLPEVDRDIPLTIGDLDLGHYKRVIVSSRRSKPHELIESLESKVPVVEYLPLDSDMIFVGAAAALKDNLIKFRRWFGLKYPKTKRMWWLTSSSFQHLENKFFELLLCSKFQDSIRQRFPGRNVTSFLLTHNILAYFFEWPLQTRVVCPNSKLGGLFKLLVKDFSLLALRFSARIVWSLSKNRKLTNPAKADVCFLAWGWWESHHGEPRDMYYTNLSKRFRDMGISVKILTPASATRTNPKAECMADGVIDFTLPATMMAAFQTARFLLSSLVATVRFKSEHRSYNRWTNKVILIQLLTQNGTLFSNLVFFNTFKKYFLRHRANIIMFYDEVYLHGRALQMALSSLPEQARPVSVGFQHGWVCENHLTYNTDPGDINMPFPACDYFFVYNLLAAEMYKNLLHEDRHERVRIVGMHRVQTEGGACSARMEGERSLNDLDNSLPVFLLLGDITVKDAWDTICDFSKQNIIQLIVKPHPIFPIPRDWLKRFELRTGSKLHVSEDFDLDYVISVSDYILSPVSTALLNAIAQKKKIILFALDNRVDEYQFQPWIESSGMGCVVRSPQMLLEFLENFSKTRPKGGISYENIDKYVPSFLGETSIEVMGKELKEILKKRKPRFCQ